MSDLKTYHVTRYITGARGSQTFSVKATSPEEAEDQVLQGEGDICHEEIEVTGLSFKCLVEEA